MSIEVDVMQMMVDEIGKILDVLTSVNNITEKLQMQITMLNFKVNCLNERVNRIDPEIPVKEPDDKETLDYYTTRCTSCGKVSPIGEYCIWCGEKGTCLEGGDHDEENAGN